LIETDARRHVTVEHDVAKFGSVDATPRRESGYFDSWANLARRRLWGFGGIAFVLVGIVFFMCEHPVLAIGSVILGLALLEYGEQAKCPRCGKKFARRWLTHNIFTAKCLNCGVRFGAPKA
jgi:hypothetical protein